MARYQSYIICTSPRSGSTLLCKLLAATEKCGNPGSHFHDPSIADWKRSYGLSAEHFTTERAALTAIFNAARAHGSGDTGLFGLRLQRRSFDFFMQQMDILHPGLSSDAERIQACFGNTLFVYLTRANKLDQAISLVKATQTGLWHMASDGTELERLSDPQDPVYDANLIAHHLAELTTLDEEWNDWFARENLEPLRVSYDALSENPAEVLAGILDQLGIDGSISEDIGPPVAKLADVTNRVWAERFIAEHRE